MPDSLIETWNIHDRINRYLLKAIPEAAIGAAISPKFRPVGKLFAHIHNVRLMWLKAAAPELLAGLEKIEEASDKKTLAVALEASGKAIAALLEKSIAA